MPEGEILDSINQKWLENIYSQLESMQEMERLAREGCNSLMEYLQVPPSMIGIMLPEIQYKNLRFFTLELSMLLNNLRPILKDKYAEYKNNVDMVITQIDKRNLFLKEIKIHGQVNSIQVLPFFNKTLYLLINMKSQVIGDIGNVLFLGQEDNKKSW